jgi:radical SAM protein with 4Fe4S-binding SPASM domain
MHSIDFRIKKYPEYNKNKENDLLLGLACVELNITELCNRTCSFCPRHDPKLYPNRNLNMSFETANIIKEQLDLLKFDGYISLSAYSEPTLHPKFLDIVKILSEYSLEVVTNGDTILKSKITIDKITEAGINKLLITDYDRNPIWKDYIKKYPELIVRDHYDDGSDRYEELNFSNRGGTLWQLKESLNRPCYIPSYKVIIDWNGDVVLCSHNWINKKIFGNIHKETISKIWMGEEFTSFRMKLISGDRSESPCNNCSVNGDSLGKKYADLWKSKYK